MRQSCKFCPLVHLPFPDVAYQDIVDALSLLASIVDTKYKSGKNINLNFIFSMNFDFTPFYFG